MWAAYGIGRMTGEFPGRVARWSAAVRRFIWCGQRAIARHSAFGRRFGRRDSQMGALMSPCRSGRHDVPMDQINLGSVGLTQEEWIAAG
jgi:hypothetical protein